MALEKARIRFITPLQGKAGEAVKKLPDGIEVRFNPNEYSLSRSMNYADVNIPGLSTPLVQFVRGEAQTLSVELFLDRSERVSYSGVSVKAGADEGASSAGGGESATKGFEGIGPELDLLRLLVTIDSALHAPPVVEFAWGKLQFRGVVTTFTEKFQMFDEKGHALRARVTLSLKRYEPPRVQAKQLSLQSPDRTKTRVVREGDRIDVIALEEYGDAAMWPAIAKKNNLARPRVLTTGMLLEIPPL